MTKILCRMRAWGTNLKTRPILSALTFFTILLLTGLFVVGTTIVLLNLSGLMPEQGDLTLQTLTGATILFGSVMAAVIASARIWVFLLGYKDLGSVGFQGRISPGILGLVVAIGIQIISFCILLVFGGLRLQAVSLTREAVINVTLITLSSLNTAVVEEILCRGVLFTAFRTSWGWWNTALVTAVAFALPHFLQNPYPFMVSAGLGLLFSGMLFAWAREISQTLWAVLGFHFGWDAAMGWLNLGGSNTPHFLIVKTNAPDWLVGEWGLVDWISVAIVGLFLAAVTFKIRCTNLRAL